MKSKRAKRAGRFEGQVLECTYDFLTPISDVVGPHHVLYPATKQDVGVVISQCRDRTVFVRSGRQVAKQDVVDGTGGAVLDLRGLASAAVEGRSVKAQAGVTTAEMTDVLVEHGLALPVCDEPNKSIASSLLRAGSSRLTHTLGPLASHVSTVQAVRPDGTITTFRDGGRGGAAVMERVRSADAIILEVGFEAVSARPLRMQRTTFPYPPRGHLLRIARALFVTDSPTARADLTLEAFVGPHGIPLASITAIGSSKRRSRWNKLQALVQRALETLPEDLREWSVDEYSGADVVEAAVESRAGAFADETIESERVRAAAAAVDEWDDFIARFSSDADRALWADTNVDGGRVTEHIAMAMRVSPLGPLTVTGYRYTPRLDVAPTSGALLKATTLHHELSPLDAIILESPMRLTARSGPIPGFEGDVYTPRDRSYRSRASQYATSSYPPQTTRPWMVAYPRHVADVAAAIHFARARGKHVVARSGGHQYSGKSSGGQDTIVLSMDAFDDLHFSGDRVEVGPAVRLTALAKRFKSRGITIPHGECPKVAIGGHAQTGGYGHLLRCFGLALDYVQAFEIVLADGSLRRIDRPDMSTPPSNEDERLDRELFWGVLGGNAGSFGIVTRYWLSYVEDSDHANSFGDTTTRRYRRPVFERLMREVKTWTEGVVDGSLSDEIDFMMTVASKGRSPFPVLLVELVHRNRTDDDAPGMAELRSVAQVASSELRWWERRLRHSGPRRLSVLSDDFVRRWPSTTRDGREFRYPYKKRVGCTMQALSDEFIDAFVELVDEVVSDTPGVKLVFQMAIGGGAYQRKGRDGSTSIPHRDFAYCLVFDLFYRRGFEHAAQDLQDRMQAVLDAHFDHGRKRRLFWGTFGDTNIDDESIRRMYYDSDAQYARLQALKAEVDPDDVFHTELTVRPADE